MVNAERSKINQRNGKLAKGKKSPEGIERSARNAMTHGIYSTKPPLCSADDYDDFEDILIGFKAQFDPVLPTEKLAAQQATMALLRLKRLYRAESAIIERQMQESTSDFEDSVVIMDDAKQLRFQREERHLQNLLDRALAKLEASQEKRMKNKLALRL